MVIHTIGYEGLTLSQFLDLLKQEGIEHLVDIREAPVSRKAEFSKASLAQAVEGVGIGYTHIRALGCPKPIRDRHKETRDWARYTRDFCIYLDGQAPALRELRKIMAAFRTCLLCYEADPRRCHRLYVAEAVTQPGEIRHIPVKPPSPQHELPL